MYVISTKAGVAVFVIGWLVLIVIFAGEASCLRSDSCRAFDFVLAILGGVGFLVPAYIFGIVVSAITGGTVWRDL